MTDQINDPERKAEIRKAWRNWTIGFLPLFAAGMIAASYFGTFAILPAMFAILIVTVLYQRFVKKRSWHSILWGVYATKE